LPEIPLPPDILKVEWDKPQLSFPQPGQQIDFEKIGLTAEYGGVANWKEYCAHRFDAHKLCIGRNMDKDYCDREYGPKGPCDAKGVATEEQRPPISQDSPTFALRR
jgi:hypothetical protein